MKYALETPPKPTWWRARTEVRPHIGFLTIATALAIVCGPYSTAVPVARAADDNPKVTIAPDPSRRSRQLTPRSGSMRVDVDLVLIPVLVTDPDQRPVRGLPKSDFHLFEDGVEREITQFFSEESPISIGIVIDASNSMRRKMDQTRAAVKEFLKMSVPGDEFFLLKFNDQPESVCGFTMDANEIEAGLSSIHAEGWTALFDAIYLGVNHMKHAKHGRKVLLVLSDGGDNNSRFSEREITNFIREADVRVFSISILERSHSLEAISEESGGRAYRVRTMDELPELAANVSLELHSEYVLGFTPAKGTADGKYRKIKVEVTPPTANGPRLHASWKRGYYSPAP
jgi:Ca-activated chloride channel homolog